MLLSSDLISSDIYQIKEFLINQLIENSLQSLIIKLNSSIGEKDTISTNVNNIESFRSYIKSILINIQKLDNIIIHYK